MNPWEEDYGDVATATEAPPWEAEFQTTEDGGQRTDTPIPTGDQLSQYDPPNAASRALEAARQYLSPILGRTAQQQMAEGPRDTEGLLPAASKPIIPLPKFTHEAGDSKPMAVGKAIGNTALGFAEFFESPLGLATAGAAAIPNAGRIVAGAFAADLGSKLPEAITTTKQTVANPAASFGEKAEAVIGTTTQAALVGVTARHAAKGRKVNTEAAALEAEIKTAEGQRGKGERETPPWEAEFDVEAGLKEAPATVESGGSPVERFIYEQRGKAQTPNTKAQTPPAEVVNERAKLEQGIREAQESGDPDLYYELKVKLKAMESSAPSSPRLRVSAVKAEPAPWEMEYAGGEMPRETSKFTDLPQRRADAEVGNKSANGGSENANGGTKIAKGGSESANVGSASAKVGSESANGGIESANGENIVARGPVFERVDVDHGTRQTEFRVRRVTDKERNERWEMFGYTPWVVERRTIRTKDGVRESGEHEQWLTFAKGETKQKAIDDGIADTSFRDAESVDAVHAKVSATRKAEALYAVDKAKRLKESEAEVRYAENAINALRDEANKKYQTALKRAKIYDLAMAGKADAAKVAAIRAKLKPEFQKRADELKADYERRKAKTKAIQDEKPPDFAKVGLEVAKVGLESAKGERANQTLEGWADKVLSEDPRKRTRMGLDPAEEARRLAAVATGKKAVPVAAVGTPPVTPPVTSAKATDKALAKPKKLTKAQEREKFDAEAKAVEETAAAAPDLNEWTRDRVARLVASGDLQKQPSGGYLGQTFVGRAFIEGVNRARTGQVITKGIAAAAKMQEAAHQKLVESINKPAQTPAAAAGKVQEHVAAVAKGNKEVTLEEWADNVLAQDPRKRTRMGLDPAEEARRLAAVAIKGSYLIARGVRDFAQWVKEITAQIPELAAKSEAELRRIYAQAVDIAEGRDPVIGDSVRGMKIKADTSLSDQVRENVEAAYTKRVSANDIAEAQRLIREAGGPEAAANDILTGLWKPVDPTVQVKGAGEVLAGLAQLEKAAGGNSARANELADLQVRVAEFSTRNATTPAQWLQAYNSLYANYSPAAWLKEWRAAVAKARRERVERATGQPVGESPTEIAQGIADGVAEGVRADAPTTAKVIEEVFGTKKGKGGSSVASPHQGKPETMPEAIERILGQKGEQAQRTARKIQDFYEREVNKFKRKHKIPELSPEDQRAILAEAKAIERLPAESLQRREAVLRLLDQLHRRKGFEWWELPIGFWYANTLSGPTTHAKNILGNSVNLGMEAGLQSLLKPTNIPLILESLGRSLSVGAKEAASILKTGHDTSARHGDKFELRRNVMDLQNGTLDKVLLPWKLVGRLLRAEDAVFFNAGQELRASILSKRANGESTAAARQAMGWTPEARTAAEAQAAGEGMTGLNYQRRVNEIIEQGRPEAVMNAAREFGYDVTFNNEPYGVLGAFTSAINRGFEAAPVFKPFILPFTRIVANVSNSSLNWTPVGSYRALRAQRKLAWLGRAENNGKLYGRAINDPLAIRDAHARALLGTAAIVGITAAAVKNVFDDNPQFMVTGSGPTNLDQRKALRAAGWIPYSVKVGDKYISYADKPPQLALAMVGHYLDAIRYKNLDREDALNRVTYALNGSFGVLLQSSWLQGLSSLFNQANRESTKNFTQGMTAQAIKTGSGVFVPAALRQLDQFFDPKRYSPDDVQGMLLAQIPWARRNGHPDLNAFGQPVSSPTSKIFWSQVEGDALVRRLAGQRVFPGVPAEGDLTPEEHYALVKYRGPILREMLATQADEWAGAPRLIAQDIVNRISSAATAQAKADLGLDEANNERRMQRKLTTK